MDDGKIIAAAFGALFAIFGKAIWETLHAEYVRRRLRIEIPPPFIDEIEIASLMDPSEKTRDKDIPSELIAEIYHEAAFKNDTVFSFQPRLINDSGTPVNDCIVKISLDYEPKNISAGFQFHELNEEFEYEVRLWSPIIRPGSNLSVNRDPVCWPARSADSEHPISIRVSPGDVQPFELCRITQKTRLLVIPSDAGWKQPRIYLSTHREYTGTITVVSLNLRSRTFNLRIAAVVNGQLATVPIEITSQDFSP